MPNETFTRYDSAEYLKTEEHIAAYMEAVMDEGGDDPAFIAHALGVVARAQHEPVGTRHWHEPRRHLQGAVRRRQS